ncbi:hypothetical protein QOT17_007465 [Balamuthia mandrillaris]
MADRVHDPEPQPRQKSRQKERTENGMSAHIGTLPPSQLLAWWQTQATTRSYELVIGCALSEKDQRLLEAFEYLIAHEETRWQALRSFGRFSLRRLFHEKTKGLYLAALHVELSRLVLVPQDKPNNNMTCSLEGLVDDLIEEYFCKPAGPFHVAERDAEFLLELLSLFIELKGQVSSLSPKLDTNEPQGHVGELVERLLLFAWPIESLDTLCGLFVDIALRQPLSTSTYKIFVDKVNSVLLTMNNTSNFGHKPTVLRHPAKTPISLTSYLLHQEEMEEQPNHSTNNCQQPGQSYVSTIAANVLKQCARLAVHLNLQPCHVPGSLPHVSLIFDLLRLLYPARRQHVWRDLDSTLVSLVTTWPRFGQSILAVVRGMSSIDEVTLYALLLLCRSDALNDPTELSSSLANTRHYFAKELVNLLIRSTQLSHSIGSIPVVEVKPADEKRTIDERESGPAEGEEDDARDEDDELLLLSLPTTASSETNSSISFNSKQQWSARKTTAESEQARLASLTNVFQNFLQQFVTTPEDGQYEHMEEDELQHLLQIAIGLCNLHSTCQLADEQISQFRQFGVILLLQIFKASQSYRHHILVAIFAALRQHASHEWCSLASGKNANREPKDSFAMVILQIAEEYTADLVSFVLADESKWLKHISGLSFCLAHRLLIRIIPFALNDEQHTCVLLVEKTVNSFLVQHFVQQRPEEIHNMHQFQFSIYLLCYLLGQAEKIFRVSPGFGQSLVRIAQHALTLPFLQRMYFYTNLARFAQQLQHTFNTTTTLKDEGFIPHGSFPLLAQVLGILIRHLQTYFRTCDTDGSPLDACSILDVTKCFEYFNPRLDSPTPTPPVSTSKDKHARRLQATVVDDASSPFLQHVKIKEPLPELLECIFALFNVCHSSLLHMEEKSSIVHELQTKDSPLELADMLNAMLQYLSSSSQRAFSAVGLFNFDSHIPSCSPGSNVRVHSPSQRYSKTTSITLGYLLTTCLIWPTTTVLSRKMVAMPSVASPNMISPENPVPVRQKKNSFSLSASPTKIDYLLSSKPSACPVVFLRHRDLPFNSRQLSLRLLDVYSTLQHHRQHLVPPQQPNQEGLGLPSTVFHPQKKAASRLSLKSIALLLKLFLRDTKKQAAHGKLSPLAMTAILRSLTSHLKGLVSFFMQRASECETSMTWDTSNSDRMLGYLLLQQDEENNVDVLQQPALLRPFPCFHFKLKKLHSLMRSLWQIFLRSTAQERLERTLPSTQLHGSCGSVGVEKEAKSFSSSLEQNEGFLVSDEAQRQLAISALIALQAAVSVHIALNKRDQESAKHVGYPAIKTDDESSCNSSCYSFFAMLSNQLEMLLRGAADSTTPIISASIIAACLKFLFLLYQLRVQQATSQHLLNSSTTTLDPALLTILFATVKQFNASQPVIKHSLRFVLTFSSPEESLHLAAVILNIVVSGRLTQEHGTSSSVPFHHIIGGLPATSQATVFETVKSFYVESLQELMLAADEMRTGSSTKDCPPSNKPRLLSAEEVALGALALTVLGPIFTPLLDFFCLRSTTSEMSWLQTSVLPMLSDVLSLLTKALKCFNKCTFALLLPSRNTYDEGTQAIVNKLRHMMHNHAHDVDDKPASRFIGLLLDFEAHWPKIFPHLEDSSQREALKQILCFLQRWKDGWQNNHGQGVMDAATRNKFWHASQQITTTEQALVALFSVKGAFQTLCYRICLLTLKALKSRRMERENRTEVSKEVPTHG